MPKGLSEKSISISMLERQVNSAGRHAACLGNLSIRPSGSDRKAFIGHGTASQNAVLTLDADRRMAAPGFVEAHIIHLDKALISECAQINISVTLTEAIELLWNKKRN